jgi:4-oxalocrotonate tautomerase
VPLVDIHLIKGVWSEEQKLEMMTATTDALVKIWGEPVRKMTWVRVLETEQGQWMINGEVWDADTVARLRGGSS